MDMARRRSRTAVPTKAVAVLALGPAGAIAVLMLGAPLWFDHASWMQFYADDFFYYLVIAEHVIAEGLSSFDGVTITNGYHPLWMWIMAGLLLLTGGSSKTLPFLILAVQVGASLTAIWLVFRMLVRRQLPALVIIGVVLLFSIADADIAITGMEVVIAVPLVIAFIGEAERVTQAEGIRFLRLGLLASACILARVDTLILIALTSLALLPYIRALPAKSSALGRVAFGLLPAGLYFSFNIIHFSTLLPISSAAKALAPGLFFNGKPFQVLMTGGDISAREELVIVVPAWAIFSRAIWGCLQLRRSNQIERLNTAVFAFPVIFYLLLALRSDWILWTWYYYPVVVALPFATAAFGEWLYRWNFLLARPVVAAATLLICSVPIVLDHAGHFAHTDPAHDGIYIAAADLAPFVATHPGRYAMGDRAGTVGYVVKEPIFQLEGIVGNAQLLADIRAGRPLLDVLREHRVDYYIGTVMPYHHGCWFGREPKVKQAGLRSPAMSGQFCSKPLFRTIDWSGIETFVFAVAAESQRHPS